MKTEFFKNALQTRKLKNDAPSLRLRIHKVRNLDNHVTNRNPQARTQGFLLRINVPFSNFTGVVWMKTMDVFWV